MIWSGGHSYVLEGPGLAGRPRWVGLDTRGRPIALSPDAIEARGWSLSPH